VQGKLYEYFFYFCDSTSRDICLGILYGYKALLQVIALVISFSIRKIKIKGLNDAKSIALAVYVTSTVTAVIIVSFYSLKEYLNLYATLFCFGFLVGTTAILCLIFIPKVGIG
jgi:gamma-aminobutyric acid type B receptor